MNQSLRRSFVGFHLTLASVVFVQSVLAVFKAILAEPDANWHLFILASVEAVAAIELYITGQRRKTQPILFRGVKRFVCQRRQE